MSYMDICILGWNLNAAMFFVNLILAVNILKSEDLEHFDKQKEILNNLQQEFEQYYPNRRFETVISFIVPFTAFYRILFKLIELYMFLHKNKGAKFYDFVVYKYQTDYYLPHYLKKIHSYIKLV